MKDAIPYLDLRPHDPASFHIRPIRPEIDPEDDAHRHNFQEILWFTGGSGRHQIDDDTLDIRPYTFYLIAKGQVHRFLGGQGLQGYLVRFTDDFLLESSVQTTWNYRVNLFGHTTLHHELPIAEGDIPQYRYLLDLLAREHARLDGYGRSDLLRHLLLSLLLMLERVRQDMVQASPHPHDPQAAVYHQFLSLLEANYKQTHFVADYAAELGLSPRQLSRILLRLTGRTAKQLIDDRLILDAKRYLRHSNYSVKEISYNLGYKDPSYFSRIFRHYTSLSPKVYRGK